LGDARGAAWSAKNRGFALFAARRLEEAVSAFEEARVAGARLGVPFLEGIGALGAAEALALDEAAEDEPELARIEDALTAAERVTAALDDRTLAWRCAALRGRLLLDRGRPAEALPELSKAVHLIERWRRRLGASGLVEHALRQRSDPYRDAALASAQLGRLDEALTFAARLQSRVLDELRARRDGPIPTPASPELDALRAEVAQRAAAGTPLEREEAEAELDAGLVAAELASGRRLVSPDERLEVTELERGLAAHGLDLALTYLVGERDTLVLRLAVGGTPALAARVLPVGRARCEGWVRTLREPIERLEAEEIDLAHLGFDVPAARAMFDALVRPLDVPPGARVALALDEVLAPVPFEILVTGGTTGPVDFGRPFAHLAGLHFLGDEHELVLLGSLARLLEPLPERSGPTVILAAPPQAGPTLATAEARELEELIPGARVVLETRASAVGELVRGAARVHVAAHGRFDGDSPAHGHLVLGGEESGATARLESWQLAELDLSGAEVVLSSCHAARGAWRAGAGLAGLLRGFFLAGAREVVASPWAVDDRVTLRFMTLYHAARTRGEPAPAALRTARLALRAASDARGFALAHPTFWAWSLYR
jgi:tetratricopeptide (TPR) repeat protein